MSYLNSETSEVDKAQFSKNLGDRIRKVREKKRIGIRDFETQEESIDRQALSRIENGLTVPSAYTLLK